MRTDYSEGELVFTRGLDEDGNETVVAVQIDRIWWDAPPGVADFRGRIMLIEDGTTAGLEDPFSPIWQTRACPGVGPVVGNLASMLKWPADVFPRPRAFWHPKTQSRG